MSSARIDASSIPSRLDGPGDLQQLSAEDQFLLDNVDGLSSVDDLSMMLGMSADDVCGCLERLANHGFVAIAVSDTGEASRGAAGRDLESTASFEVADLLAQTRSTTALPQRSRRGATPPPLSRPTLPPVMPKPSTVVSPSEKPPSSATSPAAHLSARPAVPGPSTRPPSADSTRGGVPDKVHRASAPTPRRHLDTSWWNGVDSLDEPDEKLTSREISQSGLHGVGRTLGSASKELRLVGDADARLRGADATDRVDVDDPSFTEPMVNLRGAVIAGHVEGDSQADKLVPAVPQHAVAPPGGFLRPTTKIQIDSDTSPVEVLEQVAPDPVTAQVDALSEEDDGAGSTQRHAVLSASSARPAPKAANDASRWADESLHALLKGDRGPWTLEQARCVSYFSRLVQNATFYELLGVSNDADSLAIERAGFAFRRTFAAMDLHRSRIEEARTLVQAIERGVERAVEVLLDADARARYDAALKALAAFSSLS